MIDFIEFLCSFIGILALPQTDTHLHKQHDELLGKHDKYPPNTSMCHHFSIMYICIFECVCTLHCKRSPSHIHLFGEKWRKSEHHVNRGKRSIDFSILRHWINMIYVFLCFYGFEVLYSNSYFFYRTLYMHICTHCFFKDQYKHFT